MKFKNLTSKCISFLLAVVMVVSMLPGWTVSASAEAEEEVRSVSDFAGKTLSILGASTATYAGVSNNAADNSTIGGNAVYYTEGRHGVYLKDTWWQQVIDVLGMRLLVNNSWSGSCVFRPRQGEASVGYGDRAVNLHNDYTGEEPDVILVYIGGNDFAYYKDTFGRAADVDYSALINDNGDGTFTYAVPASTCEAYAIMLHKAENRYPDAQIYCMTSTARRDPDYEDSYPDTGQPTEYSAELIKVAEHFGFPVIDLEDCIPKEAELFDQYMGDKRAHPNALGMDQISNEVLSVMLGRDAEICHVISEQGIVAEQAVLLGGIYSTEVNVPEGYVPSVVMDGEDITDEVYSDGYILIEKITGDIEVGLTRAAENFCWETNDNSLVSSGETANPLTMLSGTVTNGVFNGCRYQLTIPVVLMHDRPWVLEWKCAGDWRASVFSSNAVPQTTGVIYLSRTKGGQLCFGTWTGTQYDNYGVDISCLDNQTHTYRLENRIAEDGSNMVWLYVDEAEIGPMNNYFIGSTSQNVTSDWISGKDIVFPYIGTESNPINSCQLEYLTVTECEHAFENETCSFCGEEASDAVQPLSGQTLSILGASISTYAGTSNGDAADTTNSTIRGNAKYYPHSVVTDVTLNDTWWMQAANDLGLRLLVNNSWSGSSLLYERGGTVGAYVDRCVQLHDDTGDNAGETPDIIAIQMGTNDFQYYKDTLGTADIDYAALMTENADGTFTYAEPVTSLEAAAIVLHKISVRYPDAEVYYLNISQRVDGTDDLIQSFNAELKQVVEHFGAHIVDIYGSAITMENFDTYIGDGRVHPNRLGMDAYTEAFKRALLANTAYEVDTHTVSFDLTGVTADYGDDKIVVDGDGFTVELTANDGKEMAVTVTMGGEDITDTCYAGGTVTIDAVTADVTITAEETDHVARNYRWEFDGTDLVCVDGENTLTKNAGTTTDGVFSQTSYALADSVVLLHDQPWVVEWKCEGTFRNTGSSSGARIFTSDNVNANYNARYIFKSDNNGIIAMGEKTSSGSHNYGIALGDYGIDWTELHTYRLENRIAEDGSNMVWLYVDGVEIGAMNHYYLGTTDKDTTSDWLSGKDFVFPYMGTDTHGFTNASIDYIQVWEAGHIHDYSAVVTEPNCTEQGYTTYTCSCGDSYVDDLVDATGHSYENGICTLCKFEPSTTLVITDFVNGTYSSNSLTFYPNTRLRHDPISVKAGDQCSFSLPDGWSGYICLAYRDRNWDYAPKVWVQEYSYTFLSDMDAFVVMRKDDNSVISPDEYAGEIIFTRNEVDPDRDVHFREYYQEEIDKTIESVKALLGDEPCLVFPMVSDIHYLESAEVPYSFDYCVANLQELAKEIDFDFIACLGDITEGDTTQEITSARTSHVINGFTQLGVPYYQVIGNHDDNRYGDATFTHEQLYENYLSTITDVVFDASSMYKTNYYKDFDDLGIRCIFLNANTNGAYGYSEETCDWFDEAIKTEYGLIVFTHIPPVPAQNYGAKYGTDSGSTRIREACANADNFLIMFSGHNHYDSVFTEPFLSVTMNCQKFENENGDPDLWTEGAVKPQRVAGTESEDCFDIVVVRPESGRIDLIRFGAGEDRSFFIESLHTHTYTSVITPPTCTEQGYTTYTCTLCGDSYVDDYVEAKGHDYSAGLCTVCGHDAVSVTISDGTLTVTCGELEAGTLLYLAAYDEYGKFLSLTKIVWGGGEQTLTLPEGEKWQLMFVNSSWTPLRTHLEF